MSTNNSPSFSAGRKWSISLSLLLAVAALLAILAMANYLSARHFTRLHLSTYNPTQLSERSLKVLETVTNDVKVVVYFDSDESLYSSVTALLDEYRYRNRHINVELVDYVRNPGRAQEIKKQYKLAPLSDKDVVIFDCNGQTKFVYQSELSDLDIEPLVSGKSREVRRTHFKGELLFTSAIWSVTNPRPLKAYYLKGHGEHQLDDTDPKWGFSKFASILHENNIVAAPLSLLGTNDVPADCNLLIIAGPRNPLTATELVKLDQYLNDGRRLLALFNYYGINRNGGLLQILSSWGVRVGDDVVQDPKKAVTDQSFVTSNFGAHPIVASLSDSALYLVLPRSVQPATPSPQNNDAKPEVLVSTEGTGRVLTDIRKGIPYAHPGSDPVGAIPLAVAVEKGSLKGVKMERGTTRMVVVGDTFFLANTSIDSAGNRDFAYHAVNWLLNRSQLLSGLGPRPIKEFKLTMTRSQMSAVRWILLLGLPGTVLLMGLAVWVHRRN